MLSGALGQLSALQATGATLVEQGGRDVFCELRELLGADLHDAVWERHEFSGVNSVQRFGVTKVVR